MPKAEAYVCPRCGGPVSYGIRLKHLQCERCGQMFGADEMKRSIPVADDMEPVEREHADDADVFFERAPWEPLKEDEAGVAVYSCPVCSSRILADQATVMASCPYCGNTVLLSGIARKETVPQLMLPFTVTLEEARASMGEHFKGKWYLPSSFRPELAHVQGMYVPYYLYDIQTEGAAGFVSQREQKHGTDYIVTLVTGQGLIRRIPVDSSSRMPDAYMDQLTPFNMDSLVRFSPQYAAGYLVEVPDEDWTKSERRAKDLAYASFVKELSRCCSGSQHEVRECKFDAETTRRLLCALPVWLFNYTWKGQDYLFAVNGETGECVGNLPVSNIRRGFVFFVILPLLYVLAFIMFVKFWEFLVKGTPGDDVEKAATHIFMWLIPAMALLSSLPLVICDALDHAIMKRMRTAVKATDASETNACPEIDASRIAKSNLGRCKYEVACSRLKKDFERRVKKIRDSK